MQYAEIGDKGKKVALELKGWGEPYSALRKQTDTDGYSAFLLESHDGFNNIFAKLNQARYDIKGWWAELFANMIREGGRGTNDKGELDIIYVFSPETGKEKEIRMYAPAKGFPIPIGKFDGNNAAEILFQKNTLIPHKTIPFEKRNKAVKLWKRSGLPIEYLSGFLRPDRYKNDPRILRRVFDPNDLGYGRFGVSALSLPSNLGDDGVASRPKIVDAEDNECVMNI